MEIGDARDAYVANHALRTTMDPATPDEAYAVFMPKAKAEHVQAVFSLKSLKAQMKQCYSWSFTKNDMRRRSLFGRAPWTNVATGITGRAVMLTGRAPMADMAFFPEVEVEEEPAEGVDEAEAEGRALTRQKKCGKGGRRPTGSWSPRRSPRARWRSSSARSARHWSAS